MGLKAPPVTFACMRFVHLLTGPSTEQYLSNVTAQNGSYHTLVRSVHSADQEVIRLDVAVDEILAV